MISLASTILGLYFLPFWHKSTDLALGAEIVNGEFPLSELKTEPTEKIKIIEEPRFVEKT